AGDPLNGWAYAGVGLTLGLSGWLNGLAFSAAAPSPVHGWALGVSIPVAVLIFSRVEPHRSPCTTPCPRSCSGRTRSSVGAVRIAPQAWQRASPSVPARGPAPVPTGGHTRVVVTAVGAATGVRVARGVGSPDVPRASRTASPSLAILARMSV